MVFIDMRSASKTQEEGVGRGEGAWTKQGGWALEVPTVGESTINGNTAKFSF